MGLPQHARSAVVILTAGAHLAYLGYVPSGGFLALRRPRTVWLHVACVCWGGAVVTLRWPCPLTSLENWARAGAGMKPLPATGFIDRYVAGVCYPRDRTGAAQALAFAAAALSWVALAGKRRCHAGRESHLPLASPPGRDGLLPASQRQGGRRPIFRKCLVGQAHRPSE